MKFKEFEPRFKSAKTRFKLSAGLNLETFDAILRGNQPYLNRGLNLNRRSNSLNSATGIMNIFSRMYGESTDEFRALSLSNIMVLNEFEMNIQGVLQTVHKLDLSHLQLGKHL